MKQRSTLTTLALVAGMAFAFSGCEDGRDGAVGPAGPAGPAGDDGADASVGQVLVAADRTFTQANDLRGLTYAQVAPNAGKIYASGFVGTDAVTRRAVLARFNADASADASFGTDGFVELDIVTAQDEQSYAVAELQGGDVVVAVNATDAAGGRSVYLFRIQPDGTPAPNWGDADGKAEVVFGWANADNANFPGAPVDLPSDTAWDLQTDRSVASDRVVVFGLGAAPANDANRTDNDRFVARLNITDTGAVADPTFNGGAAFSYHTLETLNDNARRGNVEADGKILTAGYTNLGEGLGNHVILIRLTDAGVPDATFGNFSDIPDTLAAQPGFAVFNPFRVDGGFAEAYAAGRQSTGAYVTTGYGRATAADTPSTQGFATSIAQDVVIFRADGGTATAIDTGFGNNGLLAFQSEGQGFPTNEDRGRHLVVLPDDRTLHVGRFGGVPAAFMVTPGGQPDTRVAGDGVIELPDDTVDSQFFGAALSPAGNRVALSTNSNANGARLVVLKVATD